MNEPCYADRAWAMDRAAADAEHNALGLITLRDGLSLVAVR